MKYKLSCDRRRYAESREAEPEQKVHIFLFQSRSEDSIRDDEDIADINFTNLVLAKKQDGTLAPIGGPVNGSESIFDAVRQRSVERTHLRPNKNSLVELGKHEDGGVNSFYVSGRLLPEPMDVPYVLYEGDDIESFVRLSPSEAGQYLQDASTDLADINDNTLYHLNRIEAIKKINVLIALLRYKITAQTKAKQLPIREFQQKNELLRILREHLELLNVTINQSLTCQSVIETVDSLWQEHAASFSVEDLRHGLKYANLEEKINNATEDFNEEAGQGFPTVDMILPLITDDSSDYNELLILFRNPRIRKVLKIFKRLQQAAKIEGADATSMLAHLEDKEKFTLANKLYEDRNDTIEEREITFQDMGAMVDEFFSEWQQETEVPVIDQLNEIKGAGLPTLVALASGDNEGISIRPKTDLAILKFEARRKLVSILLLNDAITTRNEAVKKGINPIEEIEKSLKVPHSPLPKGTSTLLLQPSQIASRYSNKIIYSRFKANRYSSVMRTTRVKSLRSVLRKIMVRDRTLSMVTDVALLCDIYAESYIFNQVQPVDLVDRCFTIPLNPDTEKSDFQVTNKVGESTTNIYGPQVIADLITNLLIEGRGHIAIINYTPPPEHGQRLKGLGPGTGGKIRFAKFTIVHTDDAGERRFREVHVYIPNNNSGLKAEDEYLKKINDDKRYRFERAFKTLGTRSMVEELFPAEIYGEQIKDMAKARQIKEQELADLM